MGVLRAADRPAIAWKNGGGLTRDVVTVPPHSTLDNFDWRISIAEIAAGGSFSCFPGIDRRLAVLKGRVSLILDGGSAVTLDPKTDAIDFPGEAAVRAELVGGPSMDLNVMTRRGRFVSRMSRRPAGRLPVSASVTAIVAQGDLTVTGRGIESRLAALDALLIEDDSIIRTFTLDGEYCLIEISPLRRP
jgi:uncharacterized protein